MVKDLRTFPMLAELKDGELEKLSGLMREEIFPAGSRIIEEGDVGDTMYFLLEGTVEILKTTLYGEEYVCATLIDEYSCVFGEIALIDHDRRSATVRAKRTAGHFPYRRKIFGNTVWKILRQGAGF